MVTAITFGVWRRIALRRLRSSQRPRLGDHQAGAHSSQSSGQGASIDCSSSGLPVSGSSQASQSPCPRITGIRSWIGAMKSLAVVVMIV